MTNVTSYSATIDNISHVFNTVWLGASLHKTLVYILKDYDFWNLGQN